MRLLVLGGTRFLGRALVEEALERGHELTLFNRGQTNPELFPGAEKIRGDWTGDLGALVGREWDAVFDVATFLPRVVGLSVDALRRAVARHVYVSSVSVYADQSRPPVEGAPVLELEDPDDERIESYGALKAACERVVEAAFGDPATIVRPGLIVGPHDPTDRFTYWPVRVAEGGDLRFTWVPSDTLLDAGVEEWMGVPLWIASPGWQAANRVVVERALAAGLTFRPLSDTARDTLAWHTQREWPAAEGVGLSREREQELLARA